MNIADLTVQITYSEDLQTSLLLAAVRLRDAVQEATFAHEPEIRMAAARLDDVLQGIGKKMLLEVQKRQG